MKYVAQYVCDDDYPRRHKVTAISERIIILNVMPKNAGRFKVSSIRDSNDPSTVSISEFIFQNGEQILVKF